jgi:hypothetical protein
VGRNVEVDNKFNIKIMNQKINTGIALVLIAVLAGAVGYFVLAYSGKTYQAEISSGISGKAGQEASVSQKSDNGGWKTYKNDQYGFSIGYPASMPIQKNGNFDCDGGMCTIYFGKVTPCPSTNGCKNSAEEMSNQVSFSVMSPAALKANGGKDFALQCKNIQKVTLASGLKAEKKECRGAFVGSPEFIYTFDKNGSKYQIVRGSGENAAKVFDEMANSLKFLK